MWGNGQQKEVSAETVVNLDITLMCKNKFVTKEVFEADVNRESEGELYSAYIINVFQIRESGDNSNNDFKVQLLINNDLETLLADTGARICVRGERQARK